MARKAVKAGSGQSQQKAPAEAGAVHCSAGGLISLKALAARGHRDSNEVISLRLNDGVRPK